MSLYLLFVDFASISGRDAQQEDWGEMDADHWWCADSEWHGSNSVHDAGLAGIAF